MKNKTTSKILFFGLSLVFSFALIHEVANAQIALDTDNDGLSDQDEINLYGTDPLKADTDGDGYLDGKEVEGGYSPHKGPNIRMSQVDTDSDGVLDSQEVLFGSNLGKVDTDNDGHTDMDEILFGYYPNSRVTSTRLSRHIVVNRSTQRLSFLVNGVEMKNFPVSTGNPLTPTPAGEFSIQRKREYVDYIGRDYSYPRIRWNLQFLPHYYIHTATWHNDFGIRTRSHGCVNMKQDDAGFLYKYLDVGVKVTVTGTTPIKFFATK